MAKITLELKIFFEDYEDVLQIVSNSLMPSISMLEKRWNCKQTCINTALSYLLSESPQIFYYINNILWLVLSWLINKTMLTMMPLCYQSVMFHVIIKRGLFQKTKFGHVLRAYVGYRSEKSLIFQKHKTSVHSPSAIFITLKIIQKIKWKNILKTNKIY